MPLHQKLAILADAAKYDASCASSGAKRRLPSAAPGMGSAEPMGICHSYTPDGRCVSLLKLLLTNHCIYDCAYCINRRSSDTPRASFEPHEIVALTLDFYRRNYIEGLFLSSGVMKSADHTVEQMVAVAQSLREQHGFTGYIHLKAVPGASPELVDAAARYADRVSCNIELPTERDLAELAPEKKLPDIEQTMALLRAGINASTDASATTKPPLYAPAGQSTQLIVGATATPDRTILQTSERLYSRHQLKRVYYTAYSPISSSDARMSAGAPALLREHRLYQADWLIRFYGFSVNEITPDDATTLQLDKDPKLAWALRHPELFPVDPNAAPREVLLRVPGLGRTLVERLLQVRHERTLTWSVLARLRVPLTKAGPFLHVRDAPRPATSARTTTAPARARRVSPAQLELFSGREGFGKRA